MQLRIAATWMRAPHWIEYFNVTNDSLIDRIISGVSAELPQGRPTVNIAEGRAVGRMDGAPSRGSVCLTIVMAQMLFRRVFCSWREILCTCLWDQADWLAVAVETKSFDESDVGYFICVWPAGPMSCSWDFHSVKNKTYTHQNLLLNFFCSRLGRNGR